MDIIVSHTGAYRFWRAFAGDAGQFAKVRRAFAMTEPYVAMPDLDDELNGLGIFPAANCRLHLLFSDTALVCRAANVRSHVWAEELPDGALVRVAPHVLMASPELCFTQMGEVFNAAELAMAACELCGTYAIDAQTGRVEPREPLTDCAALAAFAAKVAGEDAAAVRAARQAFDGATSPMQAKLALMLSLPPEQGGYGLPLPDAAFVLAYDGRESPTSTPEPSDATPLRVTYEQVENPATFALVAESVAARLGLSLPERGDGFAARHAALRDDLGL